MPGLSKGTGKQKEMHHEPRSLMQDKGSSEHKSHGLQTSIIPHPQNRAVRLFCSKRINDETAQDKTQRFSSWGVKAGFTRGELGADYPERKHGRRELPQSTASSETQRGKARIFLS